ncbi:dienelactone hydrolase family protein [Cryptosporangium arvum]|uniref:Dienelactone hydrolase-like enzyme n=1 Tax=Cryptosporangium arvum DSM 44712 TaxID=927661 RepID=A0A011AE52_9ACTN|nr:dienelactone hydrolase family protein [Cryptosporangium arvum]EXG80306.1 dienelactone hydrolase-like enzyme [Cryptosporangium arvum DSM 44712]
MAPMLEGFDRFDFTHHGVTHPVYRAGNGPAVIVIAEIPGITPRVIEFAQRVAALGLTVYLPSLFGIPGRAPDGKAMATALRHVCVSREFTRLALRKASPVTVWLRALAKQAHEESGGPGVGAVGMCFTGGFALAMAVDRRMLAPVLAQPSLPFPLGAARKSDVGLDTASLARVKERCADEGLCVLGLRFTGDGISPPERFDRLRRELGDGFVGVEIPSSTVPAGPKAHSVLTEDLVDEPGHPTHEALEQVLQLFRDRLLV